MKRRNGLLAVAAMALLCSVGCSGMRESSGTFVAHGESFRIFGFAIPEDDQQAALNRVPAGATINSVGSSSADWTSFWGALGNIIGFHCTKIGGTR